LTSRIEKRPGACHLATVEQDVYEVLPAFVLGMEAIDLMLAQIRERTEIVDALPEQVGFS
jgi:hypothetical protein